MLQLRLLLFNLALMLFPFKFILFPVSCLLLLQTVQLALQLDNQLRLLPLHTHFSRTQLLLTEFAAHCF